MRQLVAIAAGTFVLGLAAFVHAGEMPVPPELQAALFKKIFDYDRSLSAGDSVVVLVVHGSDDSVAGSVASAFRGGGINAEVVPVAQLENRIATASVVYVTPGTDAEALESLCTEHGVLSVSGVPELAVRGHVAVGIGTHDQKPEILVHLKRVKAERHELAAELLNLARVIR